MKKIVILGGGITGLVIAKELAVEYKNAVVVIEKEHYVGGLAATLTQDRFSYDFGSHRIHSDFSPKLMSYLKTKLGVEILKRPRAGLMHFQGKFLDYPPGILNFVRTMSLKKTMKLALEFVRWFFGPERKKIKPRTYEEAMVRAVGKKVYDVFYKDFAKKMWGLDPSMVAAEGSKRRNTFVNLKSIRKTMLGMFKYFYYPKYGIGDISKKLEKSILANGGHILKGVVLKKIETRDSKVVNIIFENAQGQHQEIDDPLVISTIPADTLFGLVYGNANIPDGLMWRGLRVVYLHIKEHLDWKSETFYFPESSVVFGRVSDINKFSPYLNPSLEGTLLTIEIPCSQGEALWDADDSEIRELCVRDLIKTRVLKVQPILLNAFSMRFEKAYPVYQIGWKTSFDQIYDALKKVEGLLMAGRKGLFLHCNIDHCIIQGLETADFIFSAGKTAMGQEWHEKTKKFMSFYARD